MCHIKCYTVYSCINVSVDWRKPALVTTVKSHLLPVRAAAPPPHAVHAAAPQPPPRKVGALTRSQVAQVPATHKVKARVNQEHAADPAERHARLLGALVQVAPLDACREKGGVRAVGAVLVGRRLTADHSRLQGGQTVGPSSSRALALQSPT